MASTDARAVPLKNVAYRVTFEIRDNDGDLVTAAAALDSEISKDGGTFADCTNEATEIATSSGVYFLDLTATEMNADTVAIIVKTTTTDAKTTVIVMYPQEADDIRVSVTHWNGSTVATPDASGHPVVTLKEGTAAGELDFASGVVKSNAVQLNSLSSALLNLADSASSIVRATVDDATFTPTTTQFECLDVTEATADHFIGRRVIFISGPLDGQAAQITDYALQNSKGFFTVTTMTDAPTDGNSLVIV